jgi:hypothetical protein
MLLSQHSGASLHIKMFHPIDSSVLINNVFDGIFVQLLESPSGSFEIEKRSCKISQGSNFFSRQKFG